MATYKGIQGYSVQKLSSDPTASEAAGQLWYNSSTGQFKVGTSAAGAWASAPAINTARRSLAGTGTTTAAVIAGGIGGTTSSEVYNGSAWTTSPGSLNTGRQYLKGDGSSTAGMVFGGVDGSQAFDNTETFNGSTWSETADLNTARQKIGNSTLGSTTASLCVGGSGFDPSPALSATETWNGSSWATSPGSLNTARQAIGGAGTSTAALAIAGAGTGGSPNYTNVEQWNGSAWTELSANINTSRRDVGSAGTTTSAIIYGGQTVTAVTEQWDGTAWTEVADLAAAVQGCGSSGTSGTAALRIAGYTPPNLTTVEEWTDPVYTIKTVTVS